MQLRGELAERVGLNSDVRRTPASRRSQAEPWTLARQRSYTKHLAKAV